MTRQVPSIEELEFNALRNALYHTARRQRLEGYGRVLNLAVILGGAGTIVDFSKDLGFNPWLGLLVAVVGALQLVFDFSGRASKHEVLQRRFYDLLGRISESTEIDDTGRGQLNGELMRIYGDEPPTMRALDAVAHNEARDALFGDEHPRLKIHWWANFTRHFLAHNGTEFKP
tara:strand:+ start:42377 stop:42895 length:519 start_codon:yes stop_codon:yes gene_type:complete